MSDLEEARFALEKIAHTNQTKLGTTEVSYITIAVEILLKDYIERASKDKRNAEILG
jgi:hypothetical protein